MWYGGMAVWLLLFIISGSHTQNLASHGVLK